MASVSLRVALLKQADVHCQLATAQETPEGSASKAIEHYLTAMELLTCAVADLFQLADARKSPPQGVQHLPAGHQQQRAPSFASPLSEVFLQSVVQHKLQQYEERVRLLMEVAEGSVSNTLGDSPQNTATAAPYAYNPNEHRSNNMAANNNDYTSKNSSPSNVNSSNQTASGYRPPTTVFDDISKSKIAAAGATVAANLIRAEDESEAAAHRVVGGREEVPNEKTVSPPQNVAGDHNTAVSPKSPTLVNTTASAAAVSGSGHTNSPTTTKHSTPPPTMIARLGDTPRDSSKKVNTDVEQIINNTIVAPSPLVNNNNDVHNNINNNNNEINFDESPSVTPPLTAATRAEEVEGFDGSALCGPSSTDDGGPRQAADTAADPFDEAPATSFAFNTANSLTRRFGQEQIGDADDAFEKFFEHHLHSTDAK